MKLAADVRESEVDDQLCTRLYDVKTFGELRPYYSVSWKVKPRGAYRKLSNSLRKIQNSVE